MATPFSFIRFWTGGRLLDDPAITIPSVRDDVPLAEEQGHLASGALWAVRTMDEVPPNLKGEIASNRSRCRGHRVGTSNRCTGGSDTIGTFEDHDG